MNSKNTINKIFSKFTEDKTTNLKTHRVELNFVQDIQKLSKEIKEWIDDSDKEDEEIMDYISEIIMQKERLDRTVKSSADSVQYLKVGVKAEIDDLKNRASKAASELGIDIKDIKGMKELEALGKEALVASKNLDNSVKLGRKEAK